MDALCDPCDKLLLSYLRDHLKLSVELITVATKIETREDGCENEWTSSVEQISVPLWESLMNHGTLPSIQKDFFIPERWITFVGYEMFGGEKLSSSEIEYIEWTGNESQPGEMNCIHLNAALIIRPRGPVPKRPIESVVESSATQDPPESQESIHEEANQDLTKRVIPTDLEVPAPKRPCIE